MSDTFLCAACGTEVAASPCPSCGGEPLLNGRYLLEGVLGRGASGTTFRASDLQSGGEVAVKEMPLGRASDEKARELLHREATVLRQLEHDGIPRYVDDFVAGRGPGTALYLVQELVQGTDLLRTLDGRRFTEAEVVELLVQLCDVLIYLHGLSPPVIHRDLKPSNVMLRPDGRLVLLDFGAVRDAIQDLHLGGSTVAGTFGYMPPEQLVGDATPASDLYALGALAVHLLSRRDPKRMLKVPAGLDWEPHVRVSPGLHALLGELLALDPAERPASASEVRRRLRGDLSRGPGAVPAVAPSASRGSSGNAAPLLVLVFIVAGATMALAVVGMTAGLLLIRADDDAPPPTPVVAPVPATPLPVPAPAPTPAPTPEPDEIVEVTPELLGDLPPRGNPSAPVRIVMFTDLQCPFCARATKTMDEILADRDDVVLYVRDNPLAFHRDAHDAHHAARCANEQGRFWAMHDRLFAHQKELDALEAHAEAVGLDLSAFRDCMASGRHDAAIERDLEAGRRYGVRGVPRFFVEGASLVGAQPRVRFDEAIEAALERRR